jgi:hypothetical protein
MVEDCVFLVGAFWNIVEKKYPKMWLLKESKSKDKDKKEMEKDFLGLCASAMVQSKGFAAEQCMCLADKSALKDIIDGVMEDKTENDICEKSKVCNK